MIEWLIRSSGELVLWLVMQLESPLRLVRILLVVDERLVEQIAFPLYQVSQL